MEAIVGLPQSGALITTTTLGARGSAATLSLRRRSAVDEPHKVAVRPRACGRQSFPGKHPRNNRALLGPVHDEQHFARRRERGESQCDPGHKWFHAGLLDPDHPALAFVKRWGVWKMRCGV